MNLDASGFATGRGVLALQQLFWRSLTDWDRNGSGPGRTFVLAPYLFWHFHVDQDAMVLVLAVVLALVPYIQVDTLLEDESRDHGRKCQKLLSIWFRVVSNEIRL